MPEPYKQVFNTGEIAITSLVLDKEEFDVFVRSFEGSVEGMTKEVCEQFVQAENVPLMRRGTKTQQFFERYDIGTDFLSIIVRGAGSRVAAAQLGKHASFFPSPN